MEKAILIRVDGSKAHRKAKQAADEAMSELNEHLAAGWQVKQLRPTSGAHTHLSFSIAILTRGD